MTRISFKSSIGLFDTFTMYWNGKAFTTTEATVKILDPVAMWSWLEEHAPIVAIAFAKRVKIESI